MAIDLTGLSTAFQTWGGQVIRKKVSNWDLQNDFFFHRNVTTPMGLPKVAAGGNPRPYATAENMTDPVISDRTLTVNQSKWDWTADYENLRNKYISATSNGKLNPNETPWHNFILDQYGIEYLAQIRDNAVGAGTYNSAGATAAATMTGILTLIAAEITATTLTAIASGAMTTANCVTIVETFIDSLPNWMLDQGFKIICSYSVLKKYKAHYRTLNGYGFDREDKEYDIDGLKGRLVARGWMGSSQRLICVPDVPVTDSSNVLHFGTNDGGIEIWPTPSLNTIKVRMLFPVGLQISDLSAIFVNDQA